MRGCKSCSSVALHGKHMKLLHTQAEEEAAWAVAQKEAETRRLAEEERRRKAERAVRRAPGKPAAISNMYAGLSLCVRFLVLSACCRVSRRNA